MLSAQQKWWPAGVIGLVVIGLTGCPEPQAEAPQQQTAAPAQPQPVEKFEFVVSQLERLLGTKSRENEDMHAEGGLRSGAVQSLSHKLLPPDDTLNTYRGIITIKRQYTVTIFNRAVQEEGDSETPTEDPTAFYDNPEAAHEALLEEAPTNNTRQPSLDPMVTRENEKLYKYELEYLNDRWELLTPIESKAEASIEEAFEYALKRQ